MTIGVTVPSGTKSGTHILNVYVCLEGSPPPPNEPFDRGCDGNCDSVLVASQGTDKLYDNSVHKLYIEVP